THPRCFVSLVGFLFTRVRVLGIPFPFHTRFPEINLRFYVKRTTPQGEHRRGVVFVSEIVPRHAISLVARTLYQEPYRTLPMRHRITPTPGAAEPRTPATLAVAYQLRLHNTWQTIAATADPTPQPILPHSIEHFITEHYFGYTRRIRGLLSRASARTSEYGILHPRWSTYPIRSHTIQLDTAALYGPAFADLAHRPPDNILLAEGSAVAVLPGRRL
ncbi:MAG: DUF2071 domain-containing protein, partial [Acidobacteriota bacterium]|nr:DUF2071 domain-containing protein [Acidobacteriota bacterium]